MILSYWTKLGVIRASAVVLLPLLLERCLWKKDVDCPLNDDEFNTAVKYFLHIHLELNKTTQGKIYLECLTYQASARKKKKDNWTFSLLFVKKKKSGKYTVIKPNRIKYY